MSKGLKVHIGEVEDLGFVVFSDQEPLFCFVRETEKQAIKVARETYADYRRRFLGASGRVRAEPVEVPTHRISHPRTYDLQVA